VTEEPRDLPNEEESVSGDESSAQQPGEKGGEGITRRRLVGTTAVAAGAAIVWGSPVPFSRKGIGQSIESAQANGVTGTTGPGGSSHKSTPTEPPPPGRGGYCSVAGNTFPDGTTIPPGTFLNLEIGQPDTDPFYAGAYPANYIEGIGLTCDPPPAGYVQDGLFPGPFPQGNLYPYWRKP
jgi:hypothetical protein